MRRIINQSKVVLNNNNIIRCYSTDLKETLSSLVPIRREEFNAVKNKINDTELDKIVGSQVFGGMRGIKSMIWDNSSLDVEKGITFHNKTINDLRKELPKFKISKDIKCSSREPMTEGLIWFLLTGKVPTRQQSISFSKDLHKNSEINNDTRDFINNLPKEMHPMTKLSSSILMLQKDSVFARKYSEGINKSDYWDSTYDDIISIIAKLPEICAIIYKNTYNKENVIEYNDRLDYSANFSKMLGFNEIEFQELMRLYMLIHCDHEGGNASAHTCRLVGSTLSDPYLSLSSSMNALAGPLHGLANQEVLKWILELKKYLDENYKAVSEENIREYAWNTLNSGKVIPGYGHAVLRNTDPRFLCQREFAKNNLPNDELFKIVETLYNVLPEVLIEHGKTKNPFPNVDAHSGVLLNYYNLKEYEFYTVLFGLSRTIGVLSQLFWDRALLLPLERPKSLTLKQLESYVSRAPDHSGEI